MAMRQRLRGPLTLNNFFIFDIFKRQVKFESFIDGVNKMYKLVGNILNSLRRLKSKKELHTRIISILKLKSFTVNQMMNKYVFVQKIDWLFGNKEINSRKNVKFTTPLIEKSLQCLQPYLKISRVSHPTGAWLVFWPCGWSIAVAAAPGTYPDPYLLTLFGFGSLVMRSAGCTINDMWDRDIDRKVARTNDRPLVNGTMNMRQAWMYLAGQLSVALIILLQLNWYSVFLGASSLGLVATYPVMKRITYWPQVMLGLTLNWGLLLGYSAVHGTIDWCICGPMYIAAVCWTIIYDTIYAHQDIMDDISHGIKSTAIKFKDNTKYWLSGFSTAMVSSLAYGGFMAELTWPYYSAVVLVASHLLWQIYSLDIRSPQDCGRKFFSNQHLGVILFIGIVMGNMLKTKENLL